MLFQAHRGVSTEYPENTMLAFIAAYEQGYQVIELDPLFTQDGQCVLFHDITVCRTCRTADGEKIEAQIKAKEMTYAQLMELDAGLYMGDQFRGTKVPLFREVLEFAAQKGIHVKIDNKFEAFTPEQKEKLFSFVEETGADAGFTCAQPENIRLVAERFPKSTLHYDGSVNEKSLGAVKALLKDNTLIVWLPLASPLTSWVTVPTADEKLCALAKQFGKLGLWILETEGQLQQAAAYGADIIETTGSIKPR